MYGCFCYCRQSLEGGHGMVCYREEISGGLSSILNNYESSQYGTKDTDCLKIILNYYRKVLLFECGHQPTPGGPIASIKPVGAERGGTG